MIGSFCLVVSCADVGSVSNNLKYSMGFRPTSRFSHHWRRARCCSAAVTYRLSWALQLHQESPAVSRLLVDADRGCVFDLSHHGSCSRCYCGLPFLGKSQYCWCGGWLSRLDGAPLALPRWTSWLPCVCRAGFPSFSLYWLILLIVFRGLGALCFYSSLVRCFLLS
jgi:hypothetical protein